MSGIAGGIGVTDDKLLSRMLDVMQARGPDGVGYFSRSKINIGVTLLSLRDSGYDEPAIFKRSEDQVAVCDGYISNRRKLRGRLEARGHSFRTPSDVETIMCLHQEFGDALTELLDGDFALAVADGDSLYLARDRFGVKPLYYFFSQERNVFLFASELTALLQDEEFSPELEEQKMVDLIVPSYPVGNTTFLKGVMSVRPGHWLRVRRQGEQLQIEEKCYFRLSLDPDDSLSFDEAGKRLAELLIDAVGSRLTSAAEVGLALSGGADSTAIALIADRYHSKKLSTFTISSSPEHPDIKMARITAKRIKSDHQELIIDFEDYVQAIPRFAHLMERPLFHVGTTFYLFCAEVAKRVKVCLIGEAADSVLGGGIDCFVDKRAKELLCEGLRKANELGLDVSDEVLSIVSDLSEVQTYEQYLNNYLRAKLSDSFVAGVQFYYASAAACGVEVRDPFLARDLIGFLKVVPASLKVSRALLIDKYLFRRTCLRMFGSDIFDAVLCQKRGFGGPFREYARRFEQICELGISDEYVAAHPFGAYLPNKHRLVLFDLFKLIFIDNRGKYPSDIDVLSFISERGDATPATLQREVVTSRPNDFSARRGGVRPWSSRTQLSRLPA